MRKCFTYLLLLLIISRCNNPEQMDSSMVEDHYLTSKPGEKRYQKSLALKDQQIKASLPPENDNYNSEIKHRKKRNNNIESLPETVQGRKNDSLRLQKVIYLRKAQVDLDLNEPINQEFLLSTHENRRFPSMIQLSKESYFRFSFDNDILDYTDRFYTNGMRFELIAPFLQRSPLNKLLLPYWRSGVNYYGVSIVQNIYTPSSTKFDTILYGDRPYSSYLYFGSFKITNDPVRKYRQSSELDIGVIGPSAYGETVQKSFHSGVPPNSEPLGWEYQIKNSLVLNYTLILEKGLVSTKNVELIVNGGGNAGTLYTNLFGGFLFRTGLQNSYFSNLGVSKRSINRECGLKNTQFIFFLTGTGKLVGYDATLQGGAFGNSSPYSIKSTAISRYVFQGTAGLSFSYGGFRMDLEQYLLSEEFHHGWWHKWVRIAMTFAL